MKLKLKEGEEIRIEAENGTSEAYTIIVCYNSCILKKSQVIMIEKRL